MSSCGALIEYYFHLTDRADRRKHFGRFSSGSLIGTKKTIHKSLSRATQKQFEYLGLLRAANCIRRAVAIDHQPLQAGFPPCRGCRVPPYDFQGHNIVPRPLAFVMVLFVGELLYPHSRLPCSTLPRISRQKTREAHPESGTSALCPYRLLPRSRRTDALQDLFSGPIAPQNCIS